MSKGSLFWANASGKLGETVLYRSGGEQRTRTYVKKIKNPKTLAQMKNRLSMRNFAQIYRSLQPILSKSFPNRLAKESGFNAFVKANKSIRSAVVGEFGAQQGLSVPYNMLMSQGYLTQFGEFKQLSWGGGVQGAGFDLSNHPNIERIKEVWPVADDIDEHPTNAEGFAAMWDALQLPSTAKITVIFAEYMDEGYSLRSVSATKENGFSVLMDEPWLLKMMTVTEGGKTYPALVFSDYSKETMVTAIISWTDANGKLQVTNSRMVVPNADTTIPDDFVEGGFVYEQVLEAYGYNTDAAI